MPLIITTITTPAYFPPESGDADNTYQHLMAVLRGYFPQLIARILNGSYAESLGLDTDDIVVDEFRLAHPGEIVGDGVLIYIELPRLAPIEEIQSELRGDLRQGILSWFREIHGVKPPNLDLELSWYEPDTPG